MKKVLLWIIVIFILIQFLPIDKHNKPVEKQNNFVDIYKTPVKTQQLLKAACYDCHSNETKYPTYTSIAPISWIVKDHINQGRQYLNFSEWGTYNKDIQKNALQKSSITIENFQMPLPSYIGQHPEANLTKQQRQQLSDYFKQLQK